MRELTGMQIELIGMAVRGHVVWNDIHTGHLVLLLPLHPPILEPDLDLALGEAERVGDFDASPPRQVPIEMELLLQLQRLITRVGRALSFGFTIRIHCT